MCFEICRAKTWKSSLLEENPPATRKEERYSPLGPGAEAAPYRSTGRKGPTRTKKSCVNKPLLFGDFHTWPPSLQVQVEYVCG